MISSALPRPKLSVTTKNFCVFRVFRGSDAGMTEAATAPFSFIQTIRQLPPGLTNRGEDHLGYAVASVDDKGLSTKIDQSDLDFAAVISIYCTRSIDNRDTVFHSKTRSWPYLDLKTCRDSYSKPGGNQLDLPGLQDDLVSYCCGNIHTCSLNGLIPGQGEVPAHLRIKPAKPYIYLLHIIPYNLEQNLC